MAIWIERRVLKTENCSCILHINFGECFYLLTNLCFQDSPQSICNMHTHKPGALPWSFLSANDLSLIRAKILINPIQFWISGDFINCHRIHSHWLFPGMEYLTLISFSCAYINMKGIDVSSEELFHSPTKRSNISGLTSIH